MTKEAASKETTIVLAGLLSQAELLSLVLLLEFPWVPEGEGEELDTEDGDKDETEDERDEWMEGLGLGEGVSSTIEELEPRVVEGGLPGTEVGWAGGFEMVDGLGSTVPELEDPLVMVNAGEILPEFPITKFNMTLATEGEGAIYG